MGTFLFKYIDSEDKVHKVWIDASSWKIAQERFRENNRDIKEVITAKRHS